MAYQLAFYYINIMLFILFKVINIIMHMAHWVLTYVIANNTG